MPGNKFSDNKKRSKILEIILIALIIAVLVLCVVLVISIVKDKKDNKQDPTNKPETTATVVSDPTNTPDSGEDPKVTDIEGQTPTPTLSDNATPTEAPPATPSPTPYTGEFELVEYNGRVEHIFTHSLIAYPELCFRGDLDERLTSTFFIDCVTVPEFKGMLEALYKDGYMLININDVYVSSVDADGNKTFSLKKPIMFPKGKKPLVLSFDDVNYYSKKAGHGFVDKLCVKDGKIMSYTKMADGTEFYSDDNEHVPILEKFVREHPDFSYKGAKGMLCVTGYEGVLGYRVYRILTEGDPNDPLGLRTEASRQAEIEKVKPLVAKLKENGWYFASHSYKHGTMTNYSKNSMWDDANKFKNEITPIIGETKIYVFPYGAWQPSTEKDTVPPAQQVLLDFGFEYFCGVGVDWFAKVMNGSGSSKWYLGGIIFQDRANYDGLAMMRYRDKFLKTPDGVKRFPSLDTAVIWDEEGRGVSYEDAWTRYKELKNIS